MGRARWRFTIGRSGTKAERPAVSVRLPCQVALESPPVVDDIEIRSRLNLLLEEHRDLDNAIEALRALPGTDQIQLMRLKKRKLRLKDEIAMLQDMLLPDIIA